MARSVLASRTRSTPDPNAKENSMNSVVLIGRLTADPTSQAGEKHESATFRLAVPRPGSNNTDFVDIVTFDKLAATCAEWLTKGREVAVVGKLRLNEWTSKDGKTRSRLQVVAAAVQFLDGHKKVGDPDGDVVLAGTSAVGAYRRRAS
jgi:single-strand DNA-binding protein